MPFLRATFDLIKGVFRQPQRIYTDQENGIDATPATRSGALLMGKAKNGTNGAGTTSSSEGSGVSRKRKALDHVDANVFKRVKGSGQPLSAGRKDGFVTEEVSSPTVAQADPLTSKQKADRHMMPPPSVTVNQESPAKRPKGPKHRQSMESIDSFSENRSQRSRRGTADNEYDMEAARRLAAATQLPPDSGPWDTTEKELFFHLSYRGFEPLLSRAWMRDFPTLPLSLFAVQEDQTPLIEIHQSNEFRAIRILRELIETGKSVRDRALLSGVGGEARTEPVIERAVKRYTKWAMKDMAISTKQCIPVHAVVSMKPGQSTQDTIRDLTIKMHNLSSRHREAYDILTSIEQRDDSEQPPTPPHSPNHTTIDDLSNGNESEQELPIIYGLMICSSLLAVFTLNSHTAPPSFVVRAQNEAKKSKQQDTSGDKIETPRDGNEKTEFDNLEAEKEENEDSGLRFIASFDFSDSAADVWNAFVIAIVAMMVRKTLVNIYEIPTGSSEMAEDEESVLDSSLLEPEGPIAGSGYVSKYSSSGTRG